MLNVTFSIDNSKLKIIEWLQDHIKLHYTVEKPTMNKLEASNDSMRIHADLLMETAEESEDDITDV